MAYVFATPVAKPVDANNIALTAGRHILTNTEANSTWFTGENLTNMQWNEDRLVHPEDPTGTLLTLRAQDRPDIPLAKVPKKHDTPVPKTKDFGFIVITSAKETATFGGELNKSTNGLIRFNIQADSQVPSLTMAFKGKRIGKTTVNHRIIFHGNTAMENVTYNSPESIKNNNLDIKIPDEYASAAREGRILAVTIRFGESKAKDRYLNSVTVLHDRQDPTQPDRWSDHQHMRATFAMQTGQPFDLQVERMFIEKNIRIVFLREVKENDTMNIPRFDAEYRHWAHIMNLCINNGGPLWFYRMQKSFEPHLGAHFRKYDEADIPPPVPFWTVRKFLATVEEEKGLTRLVPLEWTPIVQDPTFFGQSEWRLPHPDQVTLLQELGVIREKAFSKRIAQQVDEWGEDEQFRSALGSERVNETLPFTKGLGEVREAQDKKSLH